jgi:hypothetical protein
MQTRTLGMALMIGMTTLGGCSESADDEEAAGAEAETLGVVGTGLLGEYYVGTNFQTLVTSRTDKTVNFDWASGAPAAGVGADGFSVRWTGQILPQYSETYTFFTSSDDGVRLRIDGRLVVDNWTKHAVTENAGTIALTAGKPVDVAMEYFENTGGAVARLSWSSPRTKKQIVPETQLFPGVSAACDAAKKARAALVPATYRPGATTTGPLSCVPLTRHDGDLTINAANAVIEGLDIYGSVILGSSATNVTIRHSIVRGPVAADDKATFIGGGTGVYNRLGLTIEDSRIDLSGRENWFRDGIAGANFTLRRTEITRSVDGVGLVSPLGNVVIEASWIHDGAFFSWTADTPGPKPSFSDMKTHNDGVQFHRGRHYVLRGNMIGGVREATPGTGDDYNNACLMISQGVDGTVANRLEDVLIEKNWFQGGAASINLAYSNGNDLSGVTIRDNRFLPGRGYYILRGAGVNAAITGNVFDATGLPVTIAAGK